MDKDAYFGARTQAEKGSSQKKEVSASNPTETADPGLKVRSLPSMQHLAEAASRISDIATVAQIA